MRLESADHPGDGGYDHEQEQYRKPDQRRTDQHQQKDATKQREHEYQQGKTEWPNVTDIDAMGSAARIKFIIGRPR